MTRNHRTLLALTFCAGCCWNAVRAQVAPPAILQVDVDNFVSFLEDIADVTKFATVPTATPAALPKNFYRSTLIADIVAVNGQPAKGTATFSLSKVGLTNTPNPGDAIADAIRGSIGVVTFEILSSDGTPVGTLISVGLTGAGSPPPGAPPAQSQGNSAIVGGTGAFVGVHGLQGQTVTPQTVAQRQASFAEDPANRRTNGGGRARFLLTLFPATAPQVVTTSSGPAIMHPDFSPVTAAKPAKADEVLIVQATGLGPTVPGVDPGQPFPPSPLQAVNSPVQVSVNGQSAQVVNAIGWPGLVNTYRVDFQVPAGTPSGTAAIQLAAAWISGPPFNIPIQ